MYFPDQFEGGFGGPGKHGGPPRHRPPPPPPFGGPGGFGGNGGCKFINNSLVVLIYLEFNV